MNAANQLREHEYIILHSLIFNIIIKNSIIMIISVKMINLTTNRM